MTVLSLIHQNHVYPSIAVLDQLELEVELVVIAKLYYFCLLLPRALQSLLQTPFFKSSIISYLLKSSNFKLKPLLIKSSTMTFFSPENSDG